MDRRRPTTLSTHDTSPSHSAAAHPPPSHLAAILQALFVTFLWSTSWVFIKLGLRGSLPPITFAGLRYSLALLCLVPLVALNPQQRRIVQRLTRQDWAQLALLGFFFYTLTQAAQFLCLAYLPAATVGLLLSLMPGVVALAGITLLHERPSRLQWAGMLLCMAGVAVYLFPLALPLHEIIGLSFGVVWVLASAGSSLLGRGINRRNHLPPLTVTFVSMGCGAFLLIIGGAVSEGFGHPTMIQWLIIGWLAVVNTAFAFVLWNHTLRTLSAVESSVLFGMMLPQTAILALIFLGEPLHVRQVAGLVLAGLGALVVQLRRRGSEE